VRLEKLENHKRIAVKALLDSRAIGLFMNTAFAKKKGFKMEKLKNLLLVRNVDKTTNMGGAIMHQVECNIGKTKVILGMPWLAAHNPEIDWEKGEVKMIQCPPICRKRKQEEKGKEVKKAERDKDEKVLKKLVPKRFWRWKKVFEKKESERIPVQKAWDHTIKLKKGFVPKKGKVYLLSKEEREEVQAFVEDQLRKEYI